MLPSAVCQPSDSNVGSQIEKSDSRAVRGRYERGGDGLDALGLRVSQTQHRDTDEIEMGDQEDRT